MRYGGSICSGEGTEIDMHAHVKRVLKIDIW